MWAWRRRVDRLGAWAIAVLGFAIAAAMTVVSGGSPLPLKLRHPAATGVIGLACLISVAAGRPLALPTLGLLARRGGASSAAAAAQRTLERAAREPGFRRRLSVATLVIGATCVCEAIAEVVLALSMPTLAFLATRVAIACGGAAILFLHARRQQAKAINAAAGLRTRSHS